MVFPALRTLDDGGASIAACAAERARDMRGVSTDTGKGERRRFMFAGRTGDGLRTSPTAVYNNT